MKIFRIVVVFTMISTLLLSVAGVEAQGPTPGRESAPTPTANAGYDPVAELLPPEGSNFSVRAVEAMGDYAYVLTREGTLYTYDISELPTTPPTDGILVGLSQPVDSLSVGYGGGLLRNGEQLYIWGTGGAAVATLADKASPKIAEAITQDHLINMVLDNDLLIGVGQGHVTAYDISDPAQPQMAFTEELGADNTGYSAARFDDILLIGQFGSGGQGTTGIVSFEITAPDTMKYLGTNTTQEAPYHLRAFDTTRVVACNSGSTVLYDYTYPDDPAQRATFQTSARVCARNGEHIVTNGDVLQPMEDYLLFVDDFTPEFGQIDGFPYGSAVEKPFIFLAQSPRVLILLGPEPLTSSSARQAPRVDGRVSVGEWKLNDALELEHGFVAARNDATHLYLLVDMLGDGQPDAGDEVSISFDVDKDGQVTPKVDVNYYVDPKTGNLRHRYYDVEGFYPDQTEYRSSRAQAYGCSPVDGSLRYDLKQGIACDEHVVWELAIALSEIGAQPGESVHMGLGVASGAPEFTDTVPANFPYNLHNFLEVELVDPVIILPPADTRSAMPFEGNPIEVTQAVQTRDNALSLVAEKDTVARVYLDNNDGSSTFMTVYLYGKRGGVDLPGSPLVTHLNVPTVVNRNDLNDTANFSLPASWVTSGSVEFRARAKRWLGAETTSGATTLAFQTREEPIVWTIPVNQGSAGSPNLLPAGDIADSKSFMETLYPVPDITFVDKPWTALGANMPHDDALIDELNDYHGTAVLAWIFGLIFTGESPFDLPDQILGFTPTSDGLSDPTWYNNGNGYVSFAGDINDGDLIMAHEINHNLDRSNNGTWGRHNGGCGSSGPDPNWPYANDDVNEVGFDTRLPWVNGVVSDRRTVITTDYPDFMSYCTDVNLPGSWISPYRWTNLFNVFAPPTTLADATDAPNPATRRALALAQTIEEVMYISGHVKREGGGELDPIVVQDGFPTPDPTGSEYVIEIRDGGGNLLDSLSFDVVFESIEGEPLDEVYFNFHVPTPEGVASIQLKQGTTLLDEITVSAHAPQVTILEPNGGELWEDTGTVQWEATDDDGDTLSFNLLYSPDDGATWYPIASDVMGNELTVDAGLLVGSMQGKIRIVASDGYNTTTADSTGNFTVANRPPNVSITAPKVGARFADGDFVSLAGEAQDPEDGALPEANYTWTVDDELVASGSKGSVVLEDGFHTVELTVVDEDGNATTLSRRVVVGNAGMVYLPLTVKP
jgi:hypothetical protein